MYTGWTDTLYCRRGFKSLSRSVDCDQSKPSVRGGKTASRTTWQRNFRLPADANGIIVRPVACRCWNLRKYTSWITHVSRVSSLAGHRRPLAYCLVSSLMFPIPAMVIGHYYSKARGWIVVCIRHAKHVSNMYNVWGCRDKNTTVLLAAYRITSKNLVFISTDGPINPRYLKPTLSNITPTLCCQC